MAGIWIRVKEKCSMRKWVKHWKTCSRKKKVIVISASAAVLLTAAGGTVFYFSRNTGRGIEMGSAVTEVSARNGEISNTVVGTGNLEADTSSSMKIPSGLVIEEVLVETGDHVTAGDTLAAVNEASVLSTLKSVQDAIADLDKEILSVQNGSEEEEITAGVSGRVKRIYVSEGSDAADSILEHGALMLLSADGKLAVKFTSASALTKGCGVTVLLSDGTSRTGTTENVSADSCTVTFSDQGIGVDETVTVTDGNGNTLGSGQAYIHQPIQVTAVGGSVAEICVAEDEAVDAGDTLLVLESSVQSIQYQELTAEREAMAETLKKLLAISKTGTITAEMDGTVEEINVSGGAAAENTASSDQSSSVSRMTYESSGNTADAGTDGTAAIALLSTETTGIGEVPNPGDTDAAGEVLLVSDTSEEAEHTENAAPADESESGETDTARLALAVRSTGSSSSGTLVIAAPVKGQEAQTEISTADGSYTGTISWSPQDSSFQAETVYKAEIKLYAADGYRFEADSIVSVETGIASGVTLSDDGKILTFQLTFSATEKEVQGDKESGTDPQEQEGNAGSTVNGASGTAGSSGAAGGQAVAGSTVSAGNSAGGGSVSTGTVSTSSGDSSTDSAEYSTDITAFGISSDENMVLSVSVDELDINSISKEQEAEVTLDAIEDETYTGTVTKIGNSASTSGGVTKYTVQITIPKDTQMKTGMNASATIVIEKKENVVTVPVNALQERGDETFVYTEKASDGTLSGEKTVTTGISDGDMVEITEGLSEGETVYYQKTGNTGSFSSDRSGGGMPDGGNFDPSSGGKDMMPEGMPGGQSMPSRE